MNQRIARKVIRSMYRYTETTKQRAFQAQDRLMRRRLRGWRARDAAERAAMPEWLGELSDIIRRMPHGAGGGIGAVSFPSVQARLAGMGDNYLAISGDGLFEFALEVVNPDCFRLQSAWLPSGSPRRAVVERQVPRADRRQAR